MSSIEQFESTLVFIITSSFTDFSNFLLFLDRVWVCKKIKWNIPTVEVVYIIVYTYFRRHHHWRIKGLGTLAWLVFRQFLVMFSFLRRRRSEWSFGTSSRPSCGSLRVWSRWPGIGWCIGDNRSLSTLACSSTCHYASNRGRSGLDSPLKKCVGIYWGLERAILGRRKKINFFWAPIQKAPQ